jgi:hypothetical protein
MSGIVRRSATPHNQSIRIFLVEKDFAFRRARRVRRG